MMNTSTLHFKRYLGWLLFCLLLPGVAPAQLQLESISATAGVIRSTHAEEIYSDHFYPLYSEVQVRATVFRPIFSVGVYWGYWNDGISEPVYNILTLTYSARAHILGARLGYRLPVLSPVEIFCGYAHHIVSTHYVGGYDQEGKPGQDFFQQFNTLELGVGMDLPIVGPLALRGGVHQQFLVDHDIGYGTQGGRLSLNLGLTYRLR